MTASHVLVGVGLGLNIIATLFLSLDALQSQRESRLLIDIQAFTLRNEISDIESERARQSRSHAERAVGDVLVPGEDMTFDEVDGIIKAGSEGAADANRKIVLGKMDELTDRFDRRYPFIKLAIASVLVGGVLELTGAVFFST